MQQNTSAIIETDSQLFSAGVRYAERRSALPPAAVAAWYDLAIEVFKGVEDPKERAEWVEWAELRQAYETRPQSGRGARRMGQFRESGKRSHHKSLGTDEDGKHDDGRSGARAGKQGAKGARQR